MARDHPDTVLHDRRAVHRVRRSQHQAALRDVIRLKHQVFATKVGEIENFVHVRHPVQCQRGLRSDVHRVPIEKLEKIGEACCAYLMQRELIVHRGCLSQLPEQHRMKRAGTGGEHRAVSMENHLLLLLMYDQTAVHERRLFVHRRERTRR